MQKANILKVKDDFSTKQPKLIQAISEKKSNRLIITKFVHLETNKAKTMPRRYYGVRLVVGVQSYIEYYHLIPREIPQDLWKKEWLNSKGELKEYARIRYMGGINRESKPYTPEETLEHVREGLADGFNPFDAIMKAIKENEAEQAVIAPLSVAKAAGPTLKDAADKFLQQYPEYIPSRPSEKNPTWEAHNVTRTLLEKYFSSIGKWLQPVVNMTTGDLKEYLQHFEKQKGWKKSTYNDKVKKLRTMFQYLASGDIIPVDPTAKLKLKTKVEKSIHAYYDADMGAKVLNLLLHHEEQPIGKFVHDYFKTIYYTCTRPDKETRQLKCGDILWDRNMIRIASERAKGGAGGYIPLAPELSSVLIEMGADKAPADYYIFGNEYKPGPKCFSEAFLTWFFREKVRKPNGIDAKYTPYGWKHTRVIDLYLAGVSIFDIQRLCRHETPTQTEEYLKELGLKVDQTVNSKSTRQL